MSSSSDDDDDPKPKQSAPSGAVSTAFAATSAPRPVVGPDVNASIRLVHMLDPQLRASIALIPSSPDVNPYKQAVLNTLDEWNRLQKVHQKSPEWREQARETYVGIVMVQTLVMILDAMMKNSGKDINFFVARSMRTVAGLMESRMHPIPTA